MPRMPRGRSRWQIALAVALISFLFMYQFPWAPAATVSASPFSSPSQLVFTTQPGGGAPATVWTGQPVVTIEDSSGATVSSSSTIVLTLTGPGGAALTGLSGTLTCDQTSNGVTSLSASGGVATFSGCSVSRPGNYTLTATDATDSLTEVSAEFFISGPARLVFTGQPGGGAAGSAWTTQPQVTVEDAHGQPVAGSTATIGLAIKAGTGTIGATLTCTQTHNHLAASSGVASFTGCAIDKAGSGYQLVATDSTDGLISQPSSSFAINSGGPASLVFTTAPSGGSGGAAFATQPVVTVEDAGGNTVSGNSDDISLSIKSGTGPSGATLTCTTNPVAAVGGVATFAGCAINDAGSGYQLVATDSAHSLSVTGAAFNVTAGSAAQIAFTTQPSGGAGGAAFGTQPVVALTDAGHNGVSGAVTLAIKAGTGTPGATLTCAANPVPSVGGVATFAGCSIDKVGTGYILTATSGGLSTDSEQFDVSVGSASVMAFTTEPGSGTGGSALVAQPVVKLTDSGGNPAAGAVTLSLTSGLGTPGATLTCAQNPVTAINGVATFTGCTVDKVGSNYTLTATSGSATATSSTFNVTLGSPHQLAFTTEPGGGTGGKAWAIQPIVAVEDAGGNQIGTSTASISLSITAGTGAGTLTCAANPLPAVNGAALFAGCAIGKTASAYTLTASDSADGLGAVSAPFAVTTGTASQLIFSSQPGGAQAGVAFPTQPVVAVADAGGNVVPGSSANIAISITSGTGAPGASLTCAANPSAASAGVATFSGCAVNQAASGYTLTATDAADGLRVESLPFAVPVAPPVPLGLAPTGIPLGQTFGGRLYGDNPTDIVDHVNTATGALTFAVTDLRVAGISEPLVLQRTYNSDDTTGGSFGPGWTSLLDVSVTVVKNKTETVRGEDGQQLVWTYNPATGTWVAPPGAKATLQCGSKQCTLTRFDGVRWDVNLTPSGHQEIADYLAPDGQGLQFAWGANQVTITVDTTNAAPYNVVATLNSAGQVTQVTTPAGRTVSYAYQNGLLTSVTDVRGNTWTYAYTSGLLTGETDPLGHLRLSATYDANGRVTAVSARGSTQHTDDTFSWNPATQTSTRRALISVGGTATREPYVDQYLGNVLVSQTQPTGAVTRYSYDAEVNLIEVQDPLGWVQQMSYDTNNNLISQSTPINVTSTATVHMTYDPAHRLTSQTDADGNTTTYVYNGPYLAFIRPPVGGSQAESTLSYNKLGELTQVLTPIGQRLFSYDAAGNQTRVLLENLSGQPLNGKGTLATYDEAGDLLTSIDARGTTTGPASAYTTTRTYDRAGNILSTTTPGPRTTTTTYDAAGDIAKIADAAGNTTAYSWHEATLTRTTTTTPAGATTSTTSTQTYDPSGDLLTQSNAAKRTTTHVYDADGRQVATTDPDNVTSQYTYDLEGNVVQVTDSAGDTITWQYDALNRPIREVNDGAVTLTGYDPNGNTISTTDANGSFTTTTYNANNQVSTVANAAGTTAYAYDLAGDLLSRTDPDGHVTTYTYDGADRQTSMTVNGATTTYGYDVAGNVTTTTDPDGRTTSYTLDALNRPVQTVYTQSGQPSITVTQAYDALGHRIGMTDPTGTHTYTYDASGDLTAATTVSGGTTDTFRYDYSQPGKIVETYPDGTAITFGVDDAQNLMSVTAGAINVSYIRNALRQTTGIAYSNGVLETRTLDQAGDVLNQTLQDAGTTLATDVFTYDAGGNPLTQVDNVGGTATTDQYSYDATGRLTGFATSTAAASLATASAAVALTSTAAASADSLQAATADGPPGGSAGVAVAAGAVDGAGVVTAAPLFRPASTPRAAPAGTTATVAPTYTYDPNGNQLSAVSSAGTTSTTYNAADEIASQSGPGGATTWTYDQQGDVTQIAGPSSTQTFTYDAADRLVKVVTTPGATVTYTYDGDGNRVSKITGGVTTQYVWDPAGPYPQLAIERTSGGTLIRRYIYGDGPVAMQTPSATYFYHLNPQGSVAELSDGTGAIVAAYHYDGFGNVTTTGANAPANPLLFQGQYLDSDTGLYNMRARNYDPTTGRFTQRDPVTAPAGVPVVSPYVFAADRPTLLADPTGRAITATSIFWGRDTSNAAANISGNVLADSAKASTAIKAGYIFLPTAFSYLKSKLSSESTTAVDELAPDVGEVADATSEIARDTSSLDGALGELGGEAGTGSEVLAGAAEASKVGPALSVVGIALQVGVTINDCISGTVSQCVADSVSTAVSIAFTVGCTVATEGAGLALCSFAGFVISTGLQYVIATYGPQIAAGFVDLYNAEVAAWTTVGTIVAAGLVTAGDAIAGAAMSAAGAIATGFNEATAAISSGFNTALNTLKAAGYTAAQIANVLANTFKEGLTQAVGALISLGYQIDDIAQAAFTVFRATAEEAAALFKEGFDYTVNAVATMLKDVYALADQTAAQILKDINYAVDEVAGALSTVYHDAVAVVGTVLKAINYGIEQIGAALQQVFNEADQAVAAALKALNYAVDEVATTLKHLYNDAAQAVAAALKFATYAVTEVATALHDVFAAAGQAAAAVLKAVGYAVDEVATALQSVYNFAAQLVAQVLENVNFAIAEVAGALRDVFSYVDTQVATILRNIGNAAADIASALNTVFSDTDVAVAAALAFAGFAAAEVASALRTAFNDIDSAVATALRAAGYAVTEIAAALETVFNDLDSAVATALRAAGYAIDQIAQGLSYAFNEAAQAVAQVLKAIGYTADQIAGALSDVFNLVAAGVAQVLTAIGEAASDIANVLENVYHEAVGVISNLLSDLGFTKTVIDDIGGAFSSFGDSVKHFFDSIF